MINIDTPEGAWFARLARELHDRRTGRSGTRRWSRGTISTSHIRPPLYVLEDYRRGDPPLRADIHSGWKPYVRQFVRMGRLNVADLLISSTSNRMQLRDFRTAAANDELGDVKAREIMRANEMKLRAREVHDTMLSLGDAYTIMTPPGGRRKHTLITSEDPQQVITAHDPATGEILAGLKMFRDEWNSEDNGYLYLPGLVRMARRKSNVSILTNGPHRLDAKGWTFDDDKDVSVPDGEIPIARFRNRDGVGEFENHLDTLDRINDKIFDEWWIAKIQAFRQRAVKNLPDTDEDTDEEIDYCMDERTEVFTARGWVNGHDVRQGDMVRSIDPATGLARWQSVQSVYRRVGKTRMVHMRSSSHDSMTTENHRWLVNDVERGGRRWAMTSELDSRMRIIRGAMPSDAPTDAKYSDALVELVAWWYTEGSYLTNGKGGQISQSRRVNPEKCARIEAAFHAMFGPTKAKYQRPLMWAMDKDRESGVVVYRFGSDLHEALVDVAPEKVPSMEFLSALTAAQLRLFVHTSLIADGHVRANASVFSQIDARRTEAFATAASLAGMAVTFAAPQKIKSGNFMYAVTVSDKRLHATVPGMHNAGRGKIEREVVEYDGLIWCPTVAEDHNFLARRNGKTYYTGNTDMFTASPDEMWQVPGDVDFWESTPVDLTPITSSIQKDLERLAAVSSLSLPSLTPDAANGSAEGASLMREEHVYKVENRIDHAEPGWSRTMRLAFLFENDLKRADVAELEAIWGPVERHSLQQKGDAAAKAKGSLPVEAIQRDIWQYAPAEIPNLRTMRGRDVLFLPPPPTN